MNSFRSQAISVRSAAGLIDHTEVLEKMNAKHNNLYSAATIKAGIYPGQDKDNKVTAVWNILVTNDNMPDQEAYDIVRLIVEKNADLVALLGGEPGQGQLADSVAPRRREVFQRKGRQDVICRTRADETAPLRRGRCR